jgi:hypothetical protein
MPEKDEVDEVIEGDQSDTEAKEESEEEKPSLEKAYQIAKATQKGYTVQQQEIAQIKGILQTIADTMNTQSGAKSGEDEYVTVGKLKEVLGEIRYQEENVKQQANDYVQASIDSLKAEGVITSKEEEDSLLNFALRHKEPDLKKAYDFWKETAEAKSEGKKEALKKQVRQEEGSKVGTSSKAEAGKKQEGVSYKEIKRMDWWNP